MGTPKYSVLSQKEGEKQGRQGKRRKEGKKEGDSTFSDGNLGFLPYLEEFYTSTTLPIFGK